MINPKIKDILEKLANGASCDYQPVQGGVLIFDEERKIAEGLEITTFLDLRNQGLISQTDKLNHWHPISPPSFRNPICRYTITKEGREYLAAQPEANKQP